jgi:hypothetical protein
VNHTRAVADFVNNGLGAFAAALLFWRGGATGGGRGRRDAAGGSEGGGGDGAQGSDPMTCAGEGVAACSSSDRNGVELDGLRRGECSSLESRRSVASVCESRRIADRY